MQELFDDMMKKLRQVRAANTDQLNLGQLIDKLETIAVTADAKKTEVVFDFEYARPTSFDSWRGVYAELACGFEMGGQGQSLLAFLEDAKSCVGKTFMGYKGGDFTMTRETPIWVANYGHSGSTAIVDVYDEGWQVVLLTAYRPL